MLQQQTSFSNSNNVNVCIYKHTVYSLKIEQHTFNSDKIEKSFRFLLKPMEADYFSTFM